MKSTILFKILLLVATLFSFMNIAQAQRSMIKVLGNVEGEYFEFTSPKPQKVLKQCKRWHNNQGITQYVDDIYVSVNGSPETHRRNGPSYWRTADAVCMQIMRVVEMEIAQPDPRPTPMPGKKMRVSGNIEGTPFLLKAKKPQKIYNKCLAMHAEEQITRYVDDIYVSVNGSPEKYHRNGPSYWKTAEAVCTQIMRSVEAYLAQNPIIDIEPVLPLDCGSRLHGEEWVEDLGVVTRNMGEARSCRHGGSIIREFAQSQSMECIDGQISSTGPISEQLLTSQAQCDSAPGVCAELFDFLGYSAHVKSLRPGQSISRLPRGLDNDISSISVSKGCKVTAYLNANYSGGTLVLTQDTPYFDSLWNDNISSIQCTCD